MKEKNNPRVHLFNTILGVIRRTLANTSKTISSSTSLKDEETDSQENNPPYAR